jgi:hypothetical protein
MHKFILLLILASLATGFATAQTSKIAVKFHKDTVLGNNKALALVKTSTTLPTSYSVQQLNGTELLSIKPVYVQISTGKRSGYYLITFNETGQTIERDITPTFSRTFVQELVETETLTLEGVDVENIRRFVSKNKRRLSDEIKATVKN